MSAWYALAGASFLVAMSGLIMGNVYYIRMIGAINQVKREGPPIPVFGWETPSRSQLIFREYRMCTFRNSPTPGQRHRR